MMACGGRRPVASRGRIGRQGLPGLELVTEGGLRRLLPWWLESGYRGSIGR